MPRVRRNTEDHGPGNRSKPTAATKAGTGDSPPPEPRSEGPHVVNPPLTVLPHAEPERRES